MGAGSSQEAGFFLVDDLPAGTWKFVADSIVVRPIDVNFAILVRRADAETVLVEWQEHFDPLPSGYGAQAGELSGKAKGWSFQTGDKLILRYAGTAGGGGMSYMPNGDGMITGGRIPNITRPSD